MSYEQSIKHHSFSELSKNGTGYPQIFENWKIQKSLNKNFWNTLINKHFALKLNQTRWIYFFLFLAIQYFSIIYFEILLLDF